MPAHEGFDIVFFLPVFFFFAFGPPMENVQPFLVDGVA
jgi:hypothetical protein